MRSEVNVEAVDAESSQANSESSVENSRRSQIKCSAHCLIVLSVVIHTVAIALMHSVILYSFILQRACSGYPKNTSKWHKASAATAGSGGSK